MGNKPLMKKLLYIPVMSGLFLFSLHADLSTNQVEKMVVKIHEKRKGADLKTLESTKEPFVIKTEREKETVFVVPVVSEKVERKMSLHAIVNGKAYINNSWKSVNDTVFGYTLKYIGKRGVVLVDENRVKKLFLHKKRDSFIKIAEGE
jgi:hypothetical protein